MLKVSVIVINYNTPKLTVQAVADLVNKENQLDWQILVIDNGSRDKVGPEDFDQPGVEVINNKKNIGFAPAVNQGLARATGDYILLLNSDLFITDRAISKMLGYIRNHKEVGLVGPLIKFPDGRFQISFGKFPSVWREFLRLSGLYKLVPGATLTRDTPFKKIDNKEIREVDWITGACLLTTKKIIKELEGVDGGYFLGGEDFDLGFRVRQKGYKAVYYPLSRVYHHHGASSGGTASIFRLKMDRDGMVRFFRKNFPGRKVSREVVKLFYNLKIFFMIAIKKFKKSFSKKHNPESATIAITYNCDARCKMCNIWKYPAGHHLSQKALSRLDGELKYINLSGGEPFLNPELPDIVKKLKEKHPRSQIIISTNGRATEFITKAAKKILEIDPRIGVRVSLDGTRETHDRIRGVPGIYDKAWATLKGLRELGVSNLGIGFTLMEDNAADLEKIYDLAQAEGLELSLTLIRNSEIYFQKEDNQIDSTDEINKQLERVINRELKSFKPKRWLRAYYNYGLKYSAETGGRLLPTGAGFDSFFVDVTGEVFPGNLVNSKMGDLEKNTLSEIWQSREAEEVRDKIKKGELQEDWTICTLRKQMKKNWYKVIPWIIKNKITIFLKR